MERVHAYWGRGSWFRKGSNVGAFSLGNQRYTLGQAWRGPEPEITLAARDQHLHFYTPQVQPPQRLPIKALTKTDLMGELGPLVNLYCFQLVLPFTWYEWRVSRLSETLGMTTL